MADKSNIIKIAAVFMLLLLIPSVLASCPSAKQVLDSATTAAEKRLGEKPTNDDVAETIKGSLSKLFKGENIGGVDPAKMDAFFSGAGAADIAAKYAEAFGDSAKREALGKAIGEITPELAKQAIASADVMKPEGYRVKPGDLAEISKYVPTTSPVYGDPNALAMMRITFESAKLPEGFRLPELKPKNYEEIKAKIKAKLIQEGVDINSPAGKIQLKQAANTAFCAERYVIEKDNIAKGAAALKAGTSVSDAIGLKKPIGSRFNIGGSSAFRESFQDRQGLDNSGPVSALARAIELGMTKHEIAIDRNLWNPTAWFSKEMYTPDTIAVMKKLAAENGVELTVHGPIYDAMPGFFTDMSPTEKANRMVQASKDAIDVAAQLGAKTMVMHMGDPTDVSSLAKAITYAARDRKSGPNYRPTDSEVQILAENTFKRVTDPNTGKVISTTYHTGEQFTQGLTNLQAALTALGVDPKSFGIIVDVAHFNIAGADTLTSVDKTISWAGRNGIKIEEVHVNQNTGTADSHDRLYLVDKTGQIIINPETGQPVPAGTVPVEAAIDRLLGINPNLKIIFEQAAELTGDAKTMSGEPNLYSIANAPAEPITPEEIIKRATELATTPQTAPPSASPASPEASTAPIPASEAKATISQLDTMIGQAAAGSPQQEQLLAALKQYVLSDLEARGTKGRVTLYLSDKAFEYIRTSAGDTRTGSNAVTDKESGVIFLKRSSFVNGDGSTNWIKERATIAHEDSHRAFLGLTAQQASAVEKAFTSSPEWEKQKSIALKNKVVPQGTTSIPDIVDEMIAYRNGNGYFLRKTQQGRYTDPEFLGLLSYVDKTINNMGQKDPALAEKFNNPVLYATREAAPKAPVNTEPSLPYPQITALGDFADPAKTPGISANNRGLINKIINGDQHNAFEMGMLLNEIQKSDPKLVRQLSIMLSDLQNTPEAQKRNQQYFLSTTEHAKRMVSTVDLDEQISLTAKGNSLEGVAHVLMPVNQLVNDVGETYPAADMVRFKSYLTDIINSAKKGFVDKNKVYGLPDVANIRSTVIKILLNKGIIT